VVLAQRQAGELLDDMTDDAWLTDLARILSSGS
jgi:hypothetical protein